MEMIFMKRGEGKTTKLICMSYLNNVPIVVATSRQAELIKHKAEVMGLKIPDPISGCDVDHLGLNLRGKNVTEAYVDNAEGLFKNLFEKAYGVKLAGFSMSTDDSCYEYLRNGFTGRQKRKDL